MGDCKSKLSPWTGVRCTMTCGIGGETAGRDVIRAPVAGSQSEGQEMKTKAATTGENLVVG